MRKTKLYDNGAFVTITTRRANYSAEIFAKATIYPSVKAFNNGDCRYVTSITDLHIGNSNESLTVLDAALERFADMLKDDADTLVYYVTHGGAINYTPEATQ